MFLLVCHWFNLVVNIPLLIASLHSISKRVVVSERRVLSSRMVFDFFDREIARSDVCTRDGVYYSPHITSSCCDERCAKITRRSWIRGALFPASVQHCLGQSSSSRVTQIVRGKRQTSAAHRSFPLSLSFSHRFLLSSARNATSGRCVRARETRNRVLSRGRP